MTWSTREWEMFCALVEEAWPGEFDDEARTSWRILLDEISPPAASAAVRRLLYSGRKFYPRPAVSDVLAEVRSDPSLPTFDEAWTLIARALVHTQTPTGTFDSPSDMAQAHNDAVLTALNAHHSAIRSFVERQGLQRLRSLPVDDPQWGEKHRRELREAWDRHLEATDGRQVAALASGRPEGLKQLDPLASLGLNQPAQIGTGKAAA
jgi:hypothetical protein